MPKTALTAADWTRAGCARLRDLGPDGLRIEAIARDLGATKGSFYWHFKNLASFSDAVLAAIEEQEQDRILQHAAEGGALEGALDLWDAQLDGALRAWAEQHEGAAGLVARLDRSRLILIAEMLGDAGQDMARLPLLLYAAQLGLDRLEASLGEMARPARLALLRMVPARGAA